MKLFTYFLIAIAFVACSPNINYLGDVYPPNLEEIDVFYDEGDINREYKIIGQLQGDNTDNPLISLDEIKSKMIESAKSRGAHGILFLISDSYQNDHIVKAKLLRYRE